MFILYELIQPGGSQLFGPAESITRSKIQPPPDGGEVYRLVLTGPYYNRFETKNSDGVIKGNYR